ncbi:extracellular solute-binding protein [Paenibacillus ferrarius]|uniref:extracellular solute-binding protein n=1 Tax=Paenibacillus ferrarius TaxID=1469647 RepID=UPI003D2BD9A5
MKRNLKLAFVCSAFAGTMLLAACTNGADKSSSPNPSSSSATNAPAATASTPLELSIAIQQVGDIPAKGNPVEQAMEKFTNTKLDFQWIPSAAYGDKINVMLASNDMPKLLRVTTSPTVTNAIQSGMFWEIGPYLKDYKNLNAANKQYYDNIGVDGKIYGIPEFRSMGRGSAVYRKDWLDDLKLSYPKTLDEWYNVIKAMTLNDPDKNGKNDTYGFMLYKGYNDGDASILSRFATMMGGVNKWGVDKDGNFTPEYMTPEFFDTMKMFRKLYSEKLLNQDFAVLDYTETEKMMDTGRNGMRFGVYGNGKSQLERTTKNVPNAVIDIAPFEGPKGIRIAAEPGNFGFLVIPKSSVKTEAEVKQVLGFLDKMMEPEMATLLTRGIEGKHFANTADGKTEFTDSAAFSREVAPYRNNIPYIETISKVKQLKDVPIGEKAAKLEADGVNYIVPNPALTLSSQTYSEKGRELEQSMMDAETKYIMGKIDDAGWQQEIDKWKKAGGEKLMAEYKASYMKNKK